MIGAAIVGYFFGKVSYMETCRQKFLTELPNSNIAMAIRKARGEESFYEVRKQPYSLLIGFTSDLHLIYHNNLSLMRNVFWLAIFLLLRALLEVYHVRFFTLNFILNSVLSNFKEQPRSTDESEVFDQRPDQDSQSLNIGSESGEGTEQKKRLSYDDLRDQHRKGQRSPLTQQPGKLTI
jgi:hypothetical protein